MKLKLKTTNMHPLPTINPSKNAKNSIFPLSGGTPVITRGPEVMTVGIPVITQEIPVVTRNTKVRTNNINYYSTTTLNSKLGTGNYKHPFGWKLPGRQLSGSPAYNYTYQGQENDGETGFEAFDYRQWDGRGGRWPNPDKVKRFHSSYMGMGNNPVYFIDPDGKDVVFHGLKKSTLTIKALGPDYSFNVNIDFHGRHTFNASNLGKGVAIGYQAAVSGSAGGGVGSKAGATATYTMFLDGDYKFYWYKYIGGEVGGTARSSAGATVDFGKSFFIATSRTGKITPESFAGKYTTFSATVGKQGAGLIGAGGFAQFSQSPDWSVYEFGVSGSFGPNVNPKFMKGVDVQYMFGGGNLKLLDNVVPTISRNILSIAINLFVRTPCFIACPVW